MTPENDRNFRKRFQYACQKSLVIRHKNEDFSESVNPFETGAIFPDRSGHKLSRNAGLMSGYAFQKNPYWGIGPGMTPKIDRIFGKVLSAKDFVYFGGPAGGSALELSLIHISEPTRPY